MITRKEAIYKGLKIGSSELGIDLSGVIPKLISEIYNDFEQHIKSLEAQLTNTEQLKCEGCIYLDDEYGCQCPIPCTRDADSEVKDFYTPKDTQ